MAICVDPKNQVILPELNIADSSGEYNINAVDKLTADFQNAVSIASETGNIISASINLYGKDNFYSSLTTLNETINLSSNIISNRINKFPELENRLNKNLIITPIEYSDFLSQYAQTPISVENLSQENPLDLASMLNSYYKGNFTSSSIGGFCALMPEIFGAVSAFFDEIGDLAGKIQDAVSFVQNLSFDISQISIQALMGQLISKIKSQITKIIDDVIEKAKNIVENFSLSNILTGVETFVNAELISKAKKLKDTAERFFEEFNIENIKNKADQMLDYAVNLFKDPSLEEIQFLVARFCQFASQIENAINEITNPLNDFASRYQNAYNTINFTSNAATARAVSVGGIRYTTQRRQEGINRTKSILVDAGNPLEPEVGEEDGITPWNNGNGDSRIGFVGGLTKTGALSEKGITWMGSEGWTKVDDKVRIMIMRVQKRFGRKLLITSGYRSQQYNDRLRSLGFGAAKNSKHVQQIALDVDWVGYNETTIQEFVSIAREEGFRGIGIYRSPGSTFVHVDIGPVRSWSG